MEVSTLVDLIARGADGEADRRRIDAGNRECEGAVTN